MTTFTYVHSTLLVPYVSLFLSIFNRRNVQAQRARTSHKVVSETKMPCHAYVEVNATADCPADP
jgi:hypothetical protein